MPSTPLDVAALRRRLAASDGPEYWRSLEDLARTPEMQALLRHELAAGPENTSYSRRSFLQLMGASMALAGLACTRQPLEKLVPYVKQPEEIVPGKPLYFATAMTLGGYATGLLVESHQGRPTKVEGNPEHPASRGATDRFAQASILGLYDPDRSQVPAHLDGIATWAAFWAELQTALGSAQATRGAGLRILTETSTSPTLAFQMRAFLARYPEARWIAYDGDTRDAVRAGAAIAFGEGVATRYDLSRADVVVSLDSDFLATGAGCVRYARDFAARRRLDDGAHSMNRLYAIESTPTSTGSLADHRLALSPDGMARFALALAAEIDPSLRVAAAAPDAKTAKWAAEVATDLRSHAGRSVVLAGDGLPAAVHALVHAMNAALGNDGSTVLHADPIEVTPADQVQGLVQLADDMRAGRVDALLVLGANPVYTAPADLDFTSAMSRVPLRIHHGLYRDETAEYCHWHVPATHELEAWSDARAYDGTAGVVQPLIEPLYDGRSVHEILAAVLGRSGTSGLDLVRETWLAKHAGAEFEAYWRRTLHDGFEAGSESPHRSRALRPDAVRREAAALAARPVPDFEVLLRPDPCVHDGRFANNGWLQELPKPWTKLTWDNAALVAPSTAERLGVQNGDLVLLRTSGAEVRAPIWILPGHAERCVTAHLGYGRRRAGRVGTGLGFDAQVLRTSASMSVAAVELTRSSGRVALASTQEHDRMEGRHLVRSATLEEFEHHPHFAHEVGHAPAPEMTLYPGHPYDGYAWGMSFDLGACMSCNACVVACDAENNVPVVGKDQVLRGREMHWLRIDRYFEGSIDDPQVHHQPVACMHCENAPCEVVCPVGATSHSPEGLNDMTYNRCVGTRYCSNNCPYKVRRFNFYKFSDTETPVLKLMRNPDVTVRTRGVMEKCTYCVQRINQARITAKVEGRSVRDGDIVTACQQVCPTEAIVFGDVNDPNSRVSRLKADSRSYGILEDLNTRPRTTYLAKIRNPNPMLEGA